jgi:hypothetical protein
MEAAAEPTEDFEGFKFVIVVGDRSLYDEDFEALAKPYGFLVSASQVDQIQDRLRTLKALIVLQPQVDFMIRNNLSAIAAASRKAVVYYEGQNRAEIASYIAKTFCNSNGTEKAAAVLQSLAPVIPQTHREEFPKPILIPALSEQETLRLQLESTSSVSELITMLGIISRKELIDMCRDMGLVDELRRLLERKH